MSRSGLSAIVGLAAAAGSFAAWRTEAPAPISSRDGGDLFISKGCASCHDGPQTTPNFSVGPSLVDVADWAAERKPGVSAREYVEESIVYPTAFMSPDFFPNGPTSSMPLLNLSPAEVDALVSYLVGG